MEKAEIVKRINKTKENRDSLITTLIMLEYNYLEACGCIYIFNTNMEQARTIINYLDKQEYFWIVPEQKVCDPQIFEYFILIYYEKAIYDFSSFEGGF